MPRQVGEQHSAIIPICVVLGLFAVCTTFLLSSPSHKTHSAGDYGIPTFSNGGRYSDGTRKAVFHKNNEQAYTASGVTDKFASFLIIVVLVGVCVALYQKSQSDGPSCSCEHH